jgi:voltage-gated potassium channel
MIKFFRFKIYLALVLILVVLLFGVLGYRYISDYSWIDALYMTIITVTTVGFSEVRPMGSEGKLFTILLIVSSVFIVGFAISVVTEFILGRNSLQIL